MWLCGLTAVQHLGRIHVAAFSDALLHNELVSKALFWQQTSFYGINMTPLHQPAVDGYFTQVSAPAVSSSKPNLKSPVAFCLQVSQSGQGGVVVTSSSSGQRR
jgi:hypothetical protein